MDKAKKGDRSTETVLRSLSYRDIAVVCKEEITVGALEACIRKAGGKLLREAVLFDIYRGQGVAEGSKSGGV